MKNKSILKPYENNSYQNQIISTLQSRKAFQNQLISHQMNFLEKSCSRRDIAWKEHEKQLDEQNGFYATQQLESNRSYNLLAHKGTTTTNSPNWSRSGFNKQRNSQSNPNLASPYEPDTSKMTSLSTSNSPHRNKQVMVARQGRVR